MATKAIFLDIDGTLVSFKTHRVPESALKAIRRVREMGVKIFIATGRALPFINLPRELEYDGVMSANGACCMDGDGKVFSLHPVPKEDIERLVEDAKEHPMAITFLSNERAVSCNVSAGRDEYEEIYRFLAIPLPEEGELDEALRMDVVEAVAFFPESDDERMRTKVITGCHSTRWHPYFADCIARGMNKAFGIDEFCRHYGFDVSETMAFGDGGNDIEMLRHAGVGVAMGNASDEVKASADVVTTSVDEDGIANVLNKL